MDLYRSESCILTKSNTTFGSFGWLLAFGFCKNKRGWKSPTKGGLSLSPNVYLRHTNFPILRQIGGGDERCVFVRQQNHLITFVFECHVAHFIWRFFRYHLLAYYHLQMNMTNVFHVGLQQVELKLWSQILVGASAIFWSI